MITKIWGCGCGRVVSAVDFDPGGPSLMPGDQRKYQILFHFLLSLLLENYLNIIGSTSFKINYFNNLGFLADLLNVFYLFSMGDLLSGRTDLGSFRPHNQQVNASRAYHHQVRSNQMIQGQDITNTTTTYYIA